MSGGACATDTATSAALATPEASTSVVYKKVANLIDALSSTVISSSTTTNSNLGSALYSPSGDRVLVAILPDSTVVRVGTARHDALRGAYCMVGGDLELRDSSRDAETGFFVLDSGSYAVMSEEEFAAAKRNEWAKSQTASRHTETAKCGDTRPPETAVEVEVKETRFDIGGVTVTDASSSSMATAPATTVVAVGPGRVQESLNEAIAVVSAAKERGSRVVIVVSGVKSDADAVAALAIRDARVLLAGAIELRVLSGGGGGVTTSSVPSEAMKAYLKASAPYDCIRSEGEGGVGLWVLPRAAIVDGEAGDVVVGDDHDAVRRAKARGAAWRAWLARLCDVGANAQDAHLLETRLCKTSSSITTDESNNNDKNSHHHHRYHSAHSEKDALREAIAPARFAYAILGSSRLSTPLSPMVHDRRWRFDRVCVNASGEEEIVASASVAGVTCFADARAECSWYCASWCDRVVEMVMRPANGSQSPVSCVGTGMGLTDLRPLDTLASLVAYRDSVTSLPLVSKLSQLSGVLGPVVTCSGSERPELMRFVWWNISPLDGDDNGDSSGGGDDAVVMLLPEAYVQSALQDLQAVAFAPSQHPVIGAFGYVTLPDKNAIPITFLNLTPMDNPVIDTSARLWRILSPDHHVYTSALPTVTRPPLPHGPLISQSEASLDYLAQKSTSDRGHRLGQGAPLSTFYVACTSEDTLSGLRVQWRERGAFSEVPVLDVVVDTGDASGADNSANTKAQTQGQVR